MSQENIPEESQSLGSFLRDHRTKKALSLEDAREFTKISLPILRAIEDDDYDRMPSETFCRGFYSMYAKYLGLDPEEILGRYLEDRGLSASPSKKPESPPVQKSGQFSNYAEPPPISPGASLGVILAICLTVIGAACWYFDWNPLSSLSSQPESSQAPAQEEQLQPESEPLREKTVVADDSTAVQPEEDGAELREHDGAPPFAPPLDNNPGSSANSSEVR